MPHNPLKSDIWSFGVTFFYMALGYYPFQAKNVFEIAKTIKMGLYKLKSNTPTIIKSIIERTLIVNPEKRATFHELRLMVEKEIEITKIPLSRSAPVTSSPSLRARKTFLTKPKTFKRVHSLVYA